MVIVYASKTGYTKQYADMLAQKTGLRAIPVQELASIRQSEELIYLGWIKVGIIQGLKKARKHTLRAVCACGTGRAAEPDAETVIARNAIGDIPFFYLRGGCRPLKQIKGMDRAMLSMFVRMLKRRETKDERTLEAIDIIENGFDGVREENLLPVLQSLENQSGRIDVMNE